MKKADIVNAVKKYFKVQEFVDKATYDKWGENAWNFLDEKLLETVLVLRRDILKVPMVCNDWSFGGKNQQRGLRSNISELVKNKTLSNTLYLSQHIFGKACDFVSSKMAADQMRKLILANQSKLPYPIRMESDVTWLHIDVMDALNQNTKVMVFKG